MVIVCSFCRPGLLRFWRQLERKLVIWTFGSNIEHIYITEKKFTLCYFKICHLNDGAHFGEVALLVADQRRVASVVAIEVCEVYRLDRKDFRQCIDVHSELFAEIERIATERIERTIRIEEQHKRFLMRPNRMPSLHN